MHLADEAAQGAPGDPAATRKIADILDTIRDPRND
jgi:hypothetical protein